MSIHLKKQYARTHQDEGLVTKRMPCILHNLPRIYIITPSETCFLLQPDPVALSLSFSILRMVQPA